MKDMFKSLAESKTGNFYIDNAGGEIQKLIGKLGSDDISDQRSVAKEAYIAMVKSSVIELNDEQIEEEVEKLLVQIERNNPDKFSYEELKRVGLWNKWGFGIDRYPLVKQLSNKNYLIAGVEPLIYVCSAKKLSSQDIFIYEKDVPNEVFNNIDSKFCWGSFKFGFVNRIYSEKKGNAKDKKLIMPFVSVSEEISDQFMDYLKKIAYVPREGIKLERLTMGEVRRIK
ncbi:MAG: hypothetical protein ABFQ65_03990 [Nanoarchaeota archaeon]